MTFQEALEALRHPPAYVIGHDLVKLALAEQIEANRVAIEELKRWLDEDEDDTQDDDHWDLDQQLT